MDTILPESFARVTSLGSGYHKLAILFTADWCGPCKPMAQIVKAAAEETGVDVCAVNVDSEGSGELCRRLGVRTIPTVLLYQDGQLKQRIIGILPQNAVVRLTQ